MRHHVHYLDLNGIVGCYPEEEALESSGSFESTVDKNIIIKRIF